METLIGGILTVATEKYEIDYRKKTIILNFSDCRGYDGSVRNIAVSSESSSTNVMLWIGTLMEQIQL